MLHALISKQIWEDIQRRLAVFDRFLYFMLWTHFRSKGLGLGTRFCQ